MAEVKNTFIQSKMNKDLDARLVPPGEYRDAENIAVSKSEGMDVGALENILGNKSITDWGIDDIGVEVIGYKFEKGKDRVFAFFTNYSDSSPDLLSNHAPDTAHCSIRVYNIKTDTVTILVGSDIGPKLSQGQFLNFSKTAPIHGIDILEDLLFWTDNRNQPRKINIESAIATPASSVAPYYSIEENISVATYYPYTPPQLYKEVRCRIKNVVQGAPPPTGTSNPSFGASGGYTSPVNHKYPTTAWDWGDGYQDLPEYTADVYSYKILGLDEDGLSDTPPYIYPGLQFYIRDFNTDVAGNFPEYIPASEIGDWPRFYTVARTPSVQWWSDTGTGAAPAIPNRTENFSSLIRTDVDVHGGLGLMGAGVKFPEVYDPDNYFNDAATFDSNFNIGDFWHHDAGPPEFNEWVEIVFVYPQMSNSTDRWLQPSMRCQCQAINLQDGASPANDATFESQSFYLGADKHFPLPNRFNEDGGPFTPYDAYIQGSIMASLLVLDPDSVNGFGDDEGGAVPPVKINSRQWLANNLFPYNFKDFVGMRVSCGGWPEDWVFVIDQIFPRGYDGNSFAVNFPDGDGDYNFCISVRRVNQDGTPWVDPLVTIGTSYDYSFEWSDLSHIHAAPAGSPPTYLEFSYPNPHYKQYYAGDEDYLTERFGRVSYRYIFEDGEESLIAPFTQSIFIPKNSGYLMWNSDVFNAFYYQNATGSQDYIKHGGIDPVETTHDLGISTINKTMTNTVETVDIEIHNPIPVNTLREVLKVKAIEILFKDSAESNIKVLKVIPTDDPSIVSETSNIYRFSYEGDKPVRTLPDTDTTRVFDQVPIRALAQSVAGNRVIYGNFINRHTPPKYLDYKVAKSKKFVVPIELSARTTVEYPIHTLKQNRMYQVGFVLSDKFGRQSDVILADPQLSVAQDDDGIIYQQDTTYADYLAYDQVYSPNSNPNPETNNIVDWVGDSLKILLEGKISSTKSSALGTPGLYNAFGDGAVSLTMTDVGNTYTAENFSSVYDVSTTAVAPATGTGLTVDVIKQNSPLTGILDAFVNNPGSGYKTGDRVTIDRGGGVGPGVVLAECEVEIGEPNPLGWYSYKVVVKQQQQDYYNIYLPSIKNGEPLLPLMGAGWDAPKENEVLTFSLLGDNINKIPEDLDSDISTTLVSSSSTKLYPRVAVSGGSVYESETNPGTLTKQNWVGSGTAYAGGIRYVAVPIESRQVFPGVQGAPSTFSPTGILETNAIDPKLSKWEDVIYLGNFDAIYSTERDTAAPSVLANIDPAQIYKQEDNPYIVVCTNKTNIGLTYTGTDYSVGGEANVTEFNDFSGGFSIFETEPFLSPLNIYWETSTSGLISDLNRAVDLDIDALVPASILVEYDEDISENGIKTETEITLPGWSGPRNQSTLRNTYWNYGGAPWGGGPLNPGPYNRDWYIGGVPATPPVADCPPLCAYSDYDDLNPFLAIITPMDIHGSSVSTVSAIVTAVDQNGTDVSNNFIIYRDPLAPAGDGWALYRTYDNFVYNQDSTVRNWDFEFHFETVGLFPGSPNVITTIGGFSLGSFNEAPETRSVGSTTWDEYGYEIATATGGIVWGARTLGVPPSSYGSNPQIGNNGSFNVIWGSDYKDNPAAPPPTDQHRYGSPQSALSELVWTIDSAIDQTGYMTPAQTMTFFELVYGSSGWDRNETGGYPHIPYWVNHNAVNALPGIPVNEYDPANPLTTGYKLVLRVTDVNGTGKSVLIPDPVDAPMVVGIVECVTGEIC